LKKTPSPLRFEAAAKLLLTFLPVSAYPKKLESIIGLFESLPEEEKRENLIAYAEQAKKHEPRPGEAFDLEDVRKDEECTDTVGVFLKVDADKHSHFRITLGPHVQTLTKAMTSILCKGLDGCTPQEITDLPADFVPRIVGGQLVRIRSQTVYYILTRMKSASRVFLNRLRAREAE
jgi:cysteine desulfuration protein SufE